MTAASVSLVWRTSSAARRASACRCSSDAAIRLKASRQDADLVLRADRGPMAELAGRERRRILLQLPQRAYDASRQHPGDDEGRHQRAGGEQRAPGEPRSERRKGDVGRQPDRNEPGRVVRRRGAGDALDVVRPDGDLVRLLRGDVPGDGCSNLLRSRPIQLAPSSLCAMTMPCSLTIRTTLPAGSARTRNASWKCSSTRADRQHRHAAVPPASSTGRATVMTHWPMKRVRTTSPMPRCWPARTCWK